MRIRQLTDVWPADLAILEIDPPNGKVASVLHAAGYTNYLSAAIDQSQLESIAAGHPGLRDRLAVYHSSKIVRQNNAEVLILHRRVAGNVALFRPIRHARFVAWECRPTLACLFATLIGLLQWILGRLKWPTVLQSTGAPRLIVFPVRRPRPHRGARRFIPHQIGVEGFLRRLQHDNIPHAVLRWFDSLPAIAPGEDLDLLVDDAHLETVRKILTNGVGIQPIDLYSVSGHSGSDFRGMPYYPPNCASQMLDGAIVHRNLCRVPALREHFLSLAYHAVYHKGSASGLADHAGAIAAARKVGTRLSRRPGLIGRAVGPGTANYTDRPRRASGSERLASAAGDVGSFGETQHLAAVPHGRGRREPIHCVAALQIWPNSKSTSSAFGQRGNIRINNVVGCGAASQMRRECGPTQRRWRSGQLLKERVRRFHC